MAKKQIDWTVLTIGEGDNAKVEGLSVTWLGAEEDDTDLWNEKFFLADIEGAVGGLDVVTEHLMLHGLKQKLADTIAGAKTKGWTLEDQVEVMTGKWADICAGKLTSRKSKVPKMTKAEAIRKLGDNATPEMLAMVDLMFG